MEPSERGCIKCGYNLTGLPAAGTIISCPECGQANDLAVPLPDRMGALEPAIWGTIPAALAMLCSGLGTMVGSGSGRVVAVVSATGLLIGAGVAAFLALKRSGLESGTGRTPLPLLARLAIGAGAVVTSVILNATIYLVVLVALAMFPHR